MAVRQIATIGDPVLRARATPVEDVRAPEIQALIDDLVDTARAANGAGLAANQIGELARVAIVEVRPGNPRYPHKPAYPLTVMVNPVVEPVGGETFAVSEGCLSVPGLRGTLARHARVRVRFLDRRGVAHEREVRGVSAGTFQHEVDHLDGVLFVDRADPRTLTTWELFERHGRAEMEASLRALAERERS